MVELHLSFAALFSLCFVVNGDLEEMIDVFLLLSDPVREAATI